MVNRKFCNGCHACAAACPVSCIHMKNDQEGFSYPEIDKRICINCKKCETVCPVLKVNNITSDKKAYAMYNKNEEIRLKSSSGGIFTLIAESIIEDGGVVFGACFDKNFRVIHDFAETKTELEKFRGSKYVQSCIGDTYKKAREFLNTGRKVLFTGTPCQIGGLNSFLGKNYDNLFTQDIICHGVPSPMVWEKYVDYRERKSFGSVRKVCFRNKDFGWKKYSVVFEFDNSEKYHDGADKDPYMQSFLRNLSLRPSCYNCAFKTADRQSDITLADFWGIENIVPEMDDDKGVSLIILNSKKGNMLFNIMKDNTEYKSVILDDAILYNPSLIKSVPKNSKRNSFMKNIKNTPFDITVNKYSKISGYVKLKIIVKKIINFCLER